MLDAEEGLAEAFNRWPQTAKHARARAAYAEARDRYTSLMRRVCELRGLSYPRDARVVIAALNR